MTGDSNTLVILMPVLLAIVAGVFAVIQIFANYWVDQRVKDKQLAEQLKYAITNSLGAVQQGVDKMMKPPDRKVINSSVPQRLFPGVQYVMDNAEEALVRWPMNSEKIAQKIVAQEGLKEIENNIAVSGSEVPVVVGPMASKDELDGLVEKKLDSGPDTNRDGRGWR